MAITVRGELEKAIANFKDTLALDDQVHFLSKRERRDRIQQIKSFELELESVILDEKGGS